METLPCIYCRKEAKLVSGEMSVKKGLVYVKVVANHYECLSCKRTFKTPEQELETTGNLQAYKDKLNTEGFKRISHKASLE